MQILGKLLICRLDIVEALFSLLFIDYIRVVIKAVLFKNSSQMFFRNRKRKFYCNDSIGIRQSTHRYVDLFFLADDDNVSTYLYFDIVVEFVSSFSL